MEPEYFDNSTPVDSLSTINSYDIILPKPLASIQAVLKFEACKPKKHGLSRKFG